MGTKKGFEDSKIQKTLDFTVSILQRFHVLHMCLHCNLCVPRTQYGHLQHIKIPIYALFLLIIYNDIILTASGKFTQWVQKGNKSARWVQKRSRISVRLLLFIHSISQLMLPEVVERSLYLLSMPSRSTTPELSKSF